MFVTVLTELTLGRQGFFTMEVSKSFYDQICALVENVSKFPYLVTLTDTEGIVREYGQIVGFHLDSDEDVLVTQDCPFHDERSAYGCEIVVYPSTLLVSQHGVFSASIQVQGLMDGWKRAGGHRQ